MSDQPRPKSGCPIKPRLRPVVSRGRHLWGGPLSYQQHSAILHLCRFTLQLVGTIPGKCTGGLEDTMNRSVPSLAWFGRLKYLLSPAIEDDEFILNDITV